MTAGQVHRYPGATGTYGMRVPAPPTSLTAPGQRRAGGWPAACCILVFTGCIGELLAPGTHALAVAAVTAITAAQVASLQRATRELLPFAAILITMLNAVGVAGYYFYEKIRDPRVGATLNSSVETYQTAARIFAVASLFAWLGALVLARGADHAPRRMYSLPKVEVTNGLSLVAVLPLALVVLGRGFESLISREGYLTYTGPASVVKVSQSMMPLGVAAAGLLCFDISRRSGKLFGYLLLVGYFAVYFSLGTRGIGLVPGLLVVAALIGGREIGWKGLLVSVIAMGVLFQLPLALRGSGEKPAGLVPFASQIASDPRSALVNDAYPIVGNLLFAVPLAGVVARDAEVPRSVLATSLTPLPSQFTDWDEIKYELQINRAVPYSGLGELGAAGWRWLALFFFGVGAFLASIQRFIAKLSGSRPVIGMLAGVGLTLFFSVNMLEYHLRSGVRLTWYLAAFVLLLRVWPERGDMMPGARKVVDRAA